MSESIASSNNDSSYELKKANELWDSGRKQVNNNKSQAEETMRTSLQNLRNAFHIAADEPELGILLHQRGKIIHDIFGCRLKMAGNTYYEECPVILSHAKYGFSIGGSADEICNICGLDPWDCEHIRGYKHNGVVARKISNVCNICLRENCNHLVGKIYDNVEVVHIITKIKLDHVSLVENPAEPLARILKYTLGPDDINKLLPDSEKSQFVPGMTIIHCHHCVDCIGC